MQLRRHTSLALPILMLALSGAACDSPESIREIVDRLGRGGSTGGGAGGAGGSGGGPRTCGGPTDIKCGPNEFCDFAAPTCGGGALGVCTSRPQACTADYRPVCGCDGKTYGNDCTRLAAGVSKLRDGECGMFVEVGEGEACGGFRPPPQRVCKKGLACVDQPGRCHSMAADAPGVCQAIPTACTKEFRPVCGCDGKTYGNDCMRKAASVGLNHEGECKTQPGGGEGARCGGIAGIPCARGFVCQPPPNSCNVADWQGTCTAAGPRPCPAIYKPVCGCDGKTYGNDCALAGTGVGKAHDGECATMSRLLPGGAWGGEHAMLLASDPKQGATIEFDCARGTITGPLEVTASGDFKWPGKYTREGGPEPANGRPSVDATYFGKVFGDVLELSVALPRGQSTAPPVKLARGQMGRLFKCQ